MKDDDVVYKIGPKTKELPYSVSQLFREYLINL
jgi:hypothetical protein